MQLLLLESEVEPLRLAAEQGSEVCARLNEQIDELAAQLQRHVEGQDLHPSRALLDASNAKEVQNGGGRSLDHIISGANRGSGTPAAVPDPRSGDPISLGGALSGVMARLETQQQQVTPAVVSRLQFPAVGSRSRSCSPGISAGGRNSGFSTGSRPPPLPLTYDGGCPPSPPCTEPAVPMGGMHRLLATPQTATSHAPHALQRPPPSPSPLMLRDVRKEVQDLKQRLQGVQVRSISF